MDNNTLCIVVNCKLTVVGHGDPGVLVQMSGFVIAHPTMDSTSAGEHFIWIKLRQFCVFLYYFSMRRSECVQCCWLGVVQLVGRAQIEGAMQALNSPSIRPIGGEPGSPENVKQNPLRTPPPANISYNTK